MKMSQNSALGALQSQTPGVNITQNSGQPGQGFKVNIREVYVSAGAGFVVAIAGQIMTMPGLPKSPAAERIDVLESGEIVGLF